MPLIRDQPGDDVAVAPVPAAAVEEALAFLAPVASPEDRGRWAYLLAPGSPPRGPGGHLLEARRAGRRVGGVLCLWRSAQAAQVFPPRVMPPDDTRVAVRLLEQLDARLSTSCVRLGYAHPPTTNLPVLTAFREAGYTQANDLLVLVRPVAEPLAQPDGPSRLQLVPYCEADRERWVAVLARCCRRTLDYPQVDRLLAPDSLLQEYAATGDSGTDHWRLVEHDGHAVGCLVLSDHRRDACCELTYMGLVPEVRGRRWGDALIRQAIRLAGRARSSHLVAAVDSGNDPALAVYSRVGFVGAGRRAVFLRVFAGRSPLPLVPSQVEATRPGAGA